MQIVWVGWLDQMKPKLEWLYLGVGAPKRNPKQKTLERVQNLLGRGLYTMNKKGGKKKKKVICENTLKSKKGTTRRIKIN